MTGCWEFDHVPVIDSRFLSQSFPERFVSVLLPGNVKMRGRLLATIYVPCEARLSQQVGAVSITITTTSISLL